jgi:hypothetical protein
MTVLSHTIEQYLRWLPMGAPGDPDEAFRYRLVEDPALPVGAWSVCDGMVAPNVWGFLVRAHPEVIAAVRLKWPTISDPARALGLLVLVEGAE